MYVFNFSFNDIGFRVVDVDSGSTKISTTGGAATGGMNWSIAFDICGGVEGVLERWAVLSDVDSFVAMHSILDFEQPSPASDNRALSANGGEATLVHLSLGVLGDTVK